MTRAKTYAYLLLLFLFASCTPSPALTPAPDEQLYTLSQNLPITYENMEIVFGNCRDETYIDSQNQTQQRLNCLFSTVTDLDASQRTDQRVFVGETIVIGRTQIRVLNIERQGLDGYKMEIGIKAIE